MQLLFVHHPRRTEGKSKYLANYCKKKHFRMSPCFTRFDNVPKMYAVHVKIKFNVILETFPLVNHNKTVLHINPRTIFYFLYFF